MTASTTKEPGPSRFWRAWRSQFRRIVDGFSVVLRDRHVASPTQFGNGQHDCALSSLYWAAPAISESDIVDAFKFATYQWPHGGVTNKEFAVALKYLKLKVDSNYSRDIDTLGALLAAKPSRCVALLPGHFIPIVNGTIVGRDVHQQWPRETRVYCHWTFTRLSRRISNWLHV